MKTLNMPPMRMGFSGRLMRFFLFALAGLLVGVSVMEVITSGGISTKTLRIATVVQDLMVFIFPAVLTAVAVSPRPEQLLGIDRGFSLRLLAEAVIVMIVSLPVMNMLVAWNESLSLPESLGGLEQWMRLSEENARESVRILLGNPTGGDLAVSLLIVAVLAGFSEEIFFRGGLQRLLCAGRLNIHAAVWLTALIFSLFHMQFYGFFPRLLLGAFFGYLFCWSGSLWLPVTVHALNNAMVVISTWLSRRDAESMMGGLDTFGSGSAAMAVCSVVLTAVVLWRMAADSGRVRQGKA